MRFLEHELVWRQCVHNWWRQNEYNEMIIGFRLINSCEEIWRWKIDVDYLHNLSDRKVIELIESMVSKQKYYANELEMAKKELDQVLIRVNQMKSFI